MKNKKRSSLATILLMLLLALVLAGCGGTTDSGGTDSGGAESGEVETGGDSEAAEAITLKFVICCGPEDAVIYDEIFAAWKAAEPQYANVTVELDVTPFAELFPKIETSVAAGADFDLFQADGPDIKHYSYNEVIISMDEYFTEEEKAAFLPSTIEEGSYLGKFMTPALQQSCSLMFYNSDMTDAAGVSPPEQLNGWTIQESWDAWEKTQIDEDGDGSPEVWGMRWGQGTWTGDYEQGIIRRSAGKRGSPTFAGVGPDAITFVGFLDTPEAISGYQAYRDMHFGDRAVTPIESIPEIFFTRQSAFVIHPDNAIGTINRLYPDGDFNYGITGIPYMEGGDQLCHTGSWHFGISPNSEHQDVAAAMIKFMTGPVGGAMYYQFNRQLPARFDVLNELPEYNESPQNLFAQGLEEIGEPRIGTPCYTEYQQLHALLLQDLQSAENLDVTARVEKAAVDIEQACAKYAGWNE
ncbi:MAG: fructooligosaccharide transport system substrate-binding protein [Cellvibrionaceae bacterium]|jgi:fructooligosaccharide transport system substrate-binding protein